MAEQSVQPSATVYLASFGALLGALTMGLALGYTSPANLDMDNDRRSGNSSIFSPDSEKFDTQKSYIGSMLGVGALVGGLLTEPCNKMLGRRLSLILVGVPFVLGWILIATANSLFLIIAGRLLTGLCTGIASGIAPTYVVEIAPPQTRGLLGTMFQVMVVIGILAEAVMGTFLGWRLLAGVSLSTAVGMILIMIFMPETPQWLLSKRREEEAETSLKRFRTSAINQEFEQLSQAANQSQQGGGGQYSCALMSSREFYKPLALSLGLMFFQQFSGINAVLFYQSDIFKQAAPQSNATMNTIYVCLAQVVATVVGSMLVDRLGRRILLLTSGLGHTVSLLVFGLYSYLKVNDTQFQENYAWLALASLVMFVVSFSLGFGPIPWMMVPELSSMRVRSIIASISTTFNWFCVTIITMFVKDLINGVGPAWTYWIFAIICAISCLFVLLFLPETKGKTSDQIQRELLGEPVDANAVRIQEQSIKSTTA